MNKQQTFFARLVRNGSLAAAVAAMLVATPLKTNAQDAKSIPLSQVERKNRAPVSKEILRVKLPKPVETTLANGLTVLILEDHRLPTVTVQLQISGAGAIFEPADRPGLASVTAQMMMQGTASRGSSRSRKRASAWAQTSPPPRPSARPRPHFKHRGFPIISSNGLH